MKKKHSSFSVTDFDYKVKGTILDQRHQPLSDALIRVFMKDNSGVVLLAEAQTDALGAYKVDYKRKYKATYGIMVRVYDNDGILLRESPLYFEVPVCLKVNLEVSDVTYGPNSELRVLLEAIAPFEHQVQLFRLTETNRKPDISFISKWIKLPYSNIEKLAMAARYARNSSVSVGVWYGLLRYLPEDYGSNLLPFPRYCNTYEERLELLMDNLMHTPVDILMGYLKKAIKENRIDASLELSLNKIRKQLLARIVSYARAHSVTGGFIDMRVGPVFWRFKGNEAEILN